MLGWTKGYIYGYKYIDDFLKEHIGHRLRYLNDFVNDDEAGIVGYKDYFETNEIIRRDK